MAAQSVDNRCLHLEAINKNGNTLRRELIAFAEDHQIEGVSLEWEEHIELVQNAKRTRLIVILLLQIAEFAVQYAVVAGEFFGRNPLSIIQDVVSRNRSIESRDLDMAQAKLAKLLKRKENSNFSIMEIIAELNLACETYGSKDKKDDAKLTLITAFANRLCQFFSSEEKFSSGQLNEVRNGKFNSSETLLSNVVWLMKQYEIYLTSLALERTIEALEPYLEKPDSDDEGTDQNLIEALESLKREVRAIPNGKETKSSIMARVTGIVNELEPWKDTDWRNQCLLLTERLIDQRNLLNQHIEEADKMRGEQIERATLHPEFVEKIEKLRPKIGR